VAYSNPPPGPPPGGGYPPPGGGYPPPGGGYPPPGGGYPPPGPSGGAYTYANWGQRAGAYLIDYAPIAVAWFVLFILNLIIQSAAFGLILWLLFSVGSLAWWIYNRVITMGNTGQSLGKRVLGIRLIGEASGAPIGAGTAFVRDIAHIVDSIICYVGWLFPLWDAKAQTLADKIMTTVVIPA
jgi:uncharacterized RDD family membrane protein YckC